VKNNAQNNVLRNEANEFADAGETATIAPTAALIHTRDVADYNALTSNCDLDKVADIRKVVHGLSSEAQMALLSAASKGTKVVTTGLPLDIAAQLGEVTVIRSWNKTREDGSRSSGSTPPQAYFAGKVIDKEAFEILKTYSEFAAAFGKGEEEGSAF
jgi:hypothetical protein